MNIQASRERNSSDYKARDLALNHFENSKNWIKYKNINPKSTVKQLIKLFKSIPEHIECVYVIKPSQRCKISLNDWVRHEKVCSCKDTLTPRRNKNQEEARNLYIGSSLSPFKRMIQHFTSYNIKVDDTLGSKHTGTCLRLGEWCKTTLDVTIYQLPGVGKDAIQFIERELKDNRAVSIGRKEN
jgi:hypothetical protein|tara:strand:- start:572 stop:1123 length:552 start_codon:yes stop_codon:yes gene_type:complete